MKELQENLVYNQVKVLKEIVLFDRININFEYLDARDALSKQYILVYFLGLLEK